MSQFVSTGSRKKKGSQSTRDVQRSVWQVDTHSVRNQLDKAVSSDPVLTSPSCQAL